MKYVASLSGGIDSAVALYSAVEMGFDVVGVVFVRYGQPTVDKEHRCAIKLVKALSKSVPLHVQSCILDPIELMSDPAENDPMPTTYVPHRNLILTAIAANLAAQVGATGIVVGWHKQDANYPDCTKSFKRALEDALTVGAQVNWSIYAPLIDVSKAEIIRRAIELNVPLVHTWSCYRSNTVPCGLCAGCLERKQGFETAGVMDFNSRERVLKRRVGTMRD